MKDMRISTWDPPGTQAKPVSATVKYDDELPPVPNAGIEQGFVLVFQVPDSVEYTHGAWLTTVLPNRTDIQRIIVGPHLDVDMLPSIPGTLEPPPLPLTPRAGLTRLEHRGFVDDGGPFLGFGTTLMYGPWAFMNDLPLLDTNLQCLADSGVISYVRSLGCVGPTGWSNRTIDPSKIDYEGYIDHCYDMYGIRVQWSIFGNLDLAGTAAKRTDIVKRLIAASKGREHKILYWEPANERIGFKGDAGRKELWRIAKMLRADTPNLVTLSADRGGETALYKGSPANLTVVHLDRSTSGLGGVWRPTRQPWEVQFLSGVPEGWVNQEPIGIDSSVKADDDPLRTVLQAANTFISGGAGYTLHTGAGIRGGGKEDAKYKRKANFAAQPTMGAILSGLKVLQTVLPADLPNWAPQNANRKFPQHPFDTTILVAADQRGDVLRSFASRKGKRFVMAPIKVEKAVPYRAKKAMNFTVIDPLTGGTEPIALEAGQDWINNRLGSLVVGSDR